MSSALPASTPPFPYNIDDALPPFQPEMYMNDTLNDCVIAARAHHTIRLVWDRIRQLITIASGDVSREYFRETGNRNSGLNLQKSLAEWQSPGWLIGTDPTERKIQGFSSSSGIQGGTCPGNDATNAINEQQLQAAIFANIGVQINLILPKTISVNTSSFGDDHPWQDTTGVPKSLHVMLLTGYDQLGFIGITWGQRQKMTWPFLQKYCFGVFTVVGSEST